MTQNKQTTVTETTRLLLRQYAERYETKDFLTGDPSWWMHQLTGKANQEAMAFIASGISYGSRKQFMPKIGQLLEWSGGEIDRWVRTGAFKEHFAPNDNRCFYRLYNCRCMHSFFEAYRILLEEDGTLGEYVRKNASDGIGAVKAICTFFAEHNGGSVVPKDSTSACKRICMFLRWMVRDDSPVDLGLWTGFIDKRTLIMPLDTHVLQQSVRLGLLASGTASMSAAMHLTKSMLDIFPDDPLRGDFALFGYGVNNDN